jgi:hypothetical protein
LETVPQVCKPNPKSNESDHKKPPRFTESRETKPKPKLSQTDKRINFLLKQYFKNDLSCRPILEKLSALDPTPNTKYLGWLTKHWCQGVRFTNGDQIRENLKMHAITCRRKRKEDIGSDFMADIFAYTPKTLQTWKAKHRKQLLYREKLALIEKGVPVTCPGAEIVYQDELYIIMRIRTRPALGLLSHYGSWCTQNYRYGTADLLDEYGEPYCFPFDLILAIDGNRYLRNFRDLRDQCNDDPPRRERDQIIELCSSVQDTLERLEEATEKCVRDGARMPLEMEATLIGYPNLAADYAVKVLGERWLEFERKASLGKIHAYSIYRYCERNAFRWERAERKILRAKYWAMQYSKLFNLSWSWPEKKK